MQSEARQSEAIKKTIEEVKRSAANKAGNQREAAHNSGGWQQGFQMRSPGGAGGPFEDVMDVDEKSAKQPKR